MLTESLKDYIEASILPLYDGFDAAHDRRHAEAVIKQSLDLAGRLDADPDMAYAVAAYHDAGLVEGREFHHLASGRIVREDAWLRDWFSDEQVEVIAQAVEDHRASAEHEPRSIYGKIVAEADRSIEPIQIIIRAVQYGLDHHSNLDRQGHWLRVRDHLIEKYGDHGYLKLWLDDSPNAAGLEALRSILRDEPELRRRFDAVYDYLASPHPQQCQCPDCQPPKYRKNLTSSR